MTRHDAVTLDAAQWMEAALHLLALHLRHEVAITRAFRGDERRDAFLGLLMSDEEAERVIDEMTGRLQLEGGHLDERAIDKAWAELITERHRDPEGIWSRMADVFELSAIELDLLVLAAAPAIDPRFGRVFGYLNDDMARRHLTPALVQRLLPVRIDALTVRRLLSERAPLIAYGLIDAENARPAIERALRVDEALLDLLLGAAPEVEGTLVHLGDGVRPERSVIVSAPTRGDASATVLDLAEAREWPLAILPPTSVPQRLRSGVRDAHLAGHIPVVSGADELSDEQLRSLQLVFQSGILLVTIAPAKWISAGIDAEPITARPVPDARRRHWLDRLNTGGALVNARHVDLLEIARLGSAATSADTLEQIVSAEASTGLGSFARRIETENTLDDLVISPAAHAGLKRLIRWQEVGPTVLEDWDMGRVYDRSRGIVALFKGPSGTGKTMAAGVIGGAIGLPVFRIDLAAIVSKFIGETEKNLEQVFTAAERTDAVLFFDEADAVFGHRSEVADSHDRYANLETAYLLQRLEAFDGISILATNLAQNMDAAFLRRIDLVVEFPAPTPEQRKLLWRRIERTDAPLANDVDLDLLAERFDLTGGEIRNCWLDAAQRAAASATSISMADLMRAVGSELIKQGKPLRKADFGSHYSSVRGDG